MSVKFANNAHSTLASSITTSATSITVASGQGARFPSLSSGEYFYATLIDTSNNLEIVKVTARSTDVLTATRAQESTTARAFASGDRIELRVTAQGLIDATTIQNDQITNALIATDAVNADSIAANAVGASELNVSGNGTAGQALLSDGDGTFSFGQGGAILAVHHVQNSTRIVPSQAVNLTWMSFPAFTKVSASSDLIIVGQVPMNGQNADNLGCWLQLNSTSDPGDNQDVHKGISYIPTNTGNHGGCTIYNKKFTGYGAVSITISVGQNNRSNTSDRPAVLNPNNSEDSRLQQNASTMTIWEVAT